MDVASFARAPLVWILARLAEVPSWLWTVLVGVLGTWLGHRLGAQGRSREAHHAEIKADVLTPLLEGIDFLLAIVEQRRSPVAVDAERVQEDEPHPLAVETPPVHHRDVLRARVPQAGPVQWMLSKADHVAVDRYLYGCAKAHHLPDLIRAFGDVVVRVGEYCGRCLRLAEDLQEALTAGAPVRPTILRPPGDPPWLNPLRLGGHILDRRLGVFAASLNRTNSEGTLRTADGVEVCRAPGGLDACVALVDRLLPDDGRATALLAEASALASELPAVRQGVEEALRMARLTGRCQYLRSRGWRSWIPWCRRRG